MAFGRVFAIVVSGDAAVVTDVLNVEGCKKLEIDRVEGIWLSRIYLKEFDTDPGQISLTWPARSKDKIKTA
jgi:hypothetical protein